MKRPKWQRIGSFIAGKGFYIVLFLCVATIGISGYYLSSAFQSTTRPAQPARTDTQVTVPDASQPEPEPPAPRPERVKPQTQQAATPAPKAEPESAPEQQTVVGPVYTWPVRGEVIGGFTLEVLAYDETMGDWRTHSGVDLAAESGEKVQAIGSGEVTRVYEDALMGWTVCIAHPDGLISTYCNLAADPPVEMGAQVVTGTVIGAVGDSAIAESGRPSHLHLELSQDGRQIDPVAFLPQD